MQIDEEKLSTNIKTNNIDNLYYLYGEEVFLTKTYTDRLLVKIVGKEPLDFNLIRLSGNVNPDILSDNIENLPMFAEKKAIVINDLDAEKMPAEDMEKIVALLKDIPETTVVIISITGLALDAKKAKTKKLITALGKIGTVCEFKYLQPAKIAEIISRKASKNACVLSKENARYLAEITLKNLTLIGEETEKLCSYVGRGNEITREVIDKLVTKQLDTSIYTLATAITSNQHKQAFSILDDLFEQRVEPIVIMSALSGAFVDFYRARVAKTAGIMPAQVVIDFAYPKNRAFVVSKAFGAVANVTPPHLRKCLNVLSDTDVKLKSTGADGRILLEQAIVRLFSR